MPSKLQVDKSGGQRENKNKKFIKHDTEGSRRQKVLEIIVRDSLEPSVDKKKRHPEIDTCDTLSLEVLLFRIDFPALLGESTAVAAPRDAAVTDTAATNTIAPADFFASAKLG